MLYEEKLYFCIVLCEIKKHITIFVKHFFCHITGSELIIRRRTCLPHTLAPGLSVSQMETRAVCVYWSQTSPANNSFIFCRWAFPSTGILNQQQLVNVNKSGAGRNGMGFHSDGISFRWIRGLNWILLGCVLKRSADVAFWTRSLVPAKQWVPAISQSKLTPAQFNAASF